MTTFMTYKEECEALRQRVAELEARLERINPLLDEAADKIDALEKQRDELLVKVAAWEQKAANWMASPEAAQRLDGYRDLAQRLNIAEQQRDELLAALERSLESFEYIAKYGNSCGHSQLRIPDLKAAIASVKGGAA